MSMPINETPGPRVRLGIPGLDEVFEGGLRAGSLIVISGPPGSGKTKLAMQLLMEMHLDAAAPPSLFLTADEEVQVLQTDAAAMLPAADSSTPHLGPLPTIARLRTRMDHATKQIVIDVSDLVGVPPEEAADVVLDDSRQRGLRGRAMRLSLKALKDHYAGANQSTPYRSIAVDGILNLPELRGCSVDERRDALFRLAQKLRALVNAQATPPHIAAILTMELSGEAAYLELEDYLADVVIHLGVDTPMKGVRRRLLEVRKARYAYPMLGEHSFWIMPDAEVERRRLTHATLGWSEEALKFIRRGIVVFPRMRWRARGGSSWIPERFETAALALRDFLSAFPAGSAAYNMLKSRQVSEPVLNAIRQPQIPPKGVLDALVLVADAITGFLHGQVRPEAPDAKVNWLIDELRAFRQYVAERQQNWSSKTPPTQRCSFGIRGLDAMFGAPARDGSIGVPRLSSTAVVGTAGTGKSTLAYTFMLRGLLDGENVIFLSFDERHRRILQQASRLTVESRSGKWASLGDEVVRQVVTRGHGRNDARLRFIYEQPVNIDLNGLMCLLALEVAALDDSGRPCRIIVDSLSDLARNMPDQFLFNNFAAILLNNASDWHATTLLTYEQSTTIDSIGTAVSHLADNILGLDQVRVNNSARKCVTIHKARGRFHSAAVAELVFHGDAEHSYVDVRKGFEGMTKVLSGHPEPAQIELRLFHENEAQRMANAQFVNDVGVRFANRVRYVPFTLSGTRSTYWHRQEGRDIRPDADVTVVALDEPWVHAFVNATHSAAGQLALWDPRFADAGQRFLVAQLLPQLCRHAAVGGAKDALRPMVALPHYMDLGLLLQRSDYMETVNCEPTCWDEAVNGGKCVSFEGLVGDAARQMGVPGFAFNMESPETTACVFLEMCWNFFANHGFLCSGEFRDRQAATRALCFLARLRWADILPFPCTLTHCSKALYTRVWYANVPAISQLAGGATWEPMPFLMASGASATLRAEFVSRMTAFIRKRIAEVIPVVKQQYPEVARGAATSYSEFLAARNAQTEETSRKMRLEERKAELELVDGPCPGYSCSGAWYLGVISDGGNTNLGWSVVQEALNPRRVEERAFSGAGLPSSLSFYRDHGNKPVPLLNGITFGSLERSFFGRVRSRGSALGMGVNEKSTSKVSEVFRELPEMLHNLVMNVLGDERSNPRLDGAEAARAFIEWEVAIVFEHIREITGVQVAPEHRKEAEEVDTAERLG